MGAILGLLLPTVVAWMAIRAWIPEASRSAPETAGLAFGTGIGLAALLTIWLLSHGVSLGPVYVAIDAAVWLAIGFAAWRRMRRRGAGNSAALAHLTAPRTTLDVIVRVLFVMVAAMAIGTALMEYHAAPHGQWDAWAIWNQKARFLLRGGSRWTNELLIDFSNPGHPLLVPGAVARLWAYAGSELTAAPAMLAFLFGAASVAVVMGALDLRRTRAWIAGAVLVAPPMYLHQVMSQQADVPAGFFIVATLALLRKEGAQDWSDTTARRATLLAAGLLSGLSAWTKNEGIVFIAIVAILVAWIAYRYGRVRDGLWWVAGAAPALLTVLWFKLAIAPVTPPYLDKNAGLATVVHMLVSPARWAIVLPLVWSRGVAWGGPLARGVIPAGIVAAGVVCATRAGRPARPVLAATVLMLASYVVVYVLSPLDIAWLVSTSFDRVLAQLWPALVLAVFSAARPNVAS